MSADTTGKKAVIYARVSSIKQTVAGDGLGSQETRCRQFAASRGYDVIGVFQDDVSGSLTERPGMRAMLQFVRKRRDRTVVIIDDISRLARGLEAHLELRATIAKAGGKLESPSVEFSDSADSRLIEHLLATVSQHGRDKNGEQTVNRMRARVLSGYWPFACPVGYRYERVTGRGKMLIRDEPVATVIQEALEAYAAGELETQADVARALAQSALFPKDSKGNVPNQRAAAILSSPLYAGYVEAPRWDVSLRQGQHEPLISFQTYMRIQDRLNGVNRAPKRKNLNAGFALRGFVTCAHCQTPLTGYWAKGTHARYAYYHCFKKGCPAYAKSIPRDRLEGEFENLLHSVTPKPGVYRLVKALLSDMWEHRNQQTEGKAKALSAELSKIEGNISR